MQRQNTLHIRDRLLTGLDKENNVVNPAIVADVLSQLDTIQITKEELEATRLGRHINELRKRTDNNQIKARAKSLIKKWRDTFVQQQQQQQNGQSAAQQPAQSLPAVAKTNGGEPPPGGGGPLNGHHRHKQSAHPLRATSSSLPSSTSTSPGLSRPATPKASPPPASGLKNGGAVNGLKRPRHEAEDSDVDVVEVDDDDDVVVSQVAPPAAKKQRVNGYHHHHQAASHCDSNNKLQNSVISESVNRPTPGRRKTRSQQRAAPSLNEQTDTLKQQMQVAAQGSVRGQSRVKTTQELVQELSLKRTTSPGMPIPPPTAAATPQTGAAPIGGVEETQEQLMNRYFESQNGKGQGKETSPPTSLGVPSPPSEPTAAESGNANRPETVEDVMARLPPVDVAAVLAEMARDAEMEPDSDDDVEMEGLIPVKRPEPTTVTDDLVEVLHQGQKESFNGNFAHDGDFKEWHEVVTKATLGGDLIHILPYSVID